MKGVARHRPAWVIVLASALLLTGAFLFAVLRTHGIHGDECSIALNAWSLAEHGVDEHGVAHPVYFRAFGEWKNPIVIYVLASVFEITGPSIVAARMTTASLILLSAAITAILGFRLGGRPGLAAGILFSLSFPWWLDLGKLVFEVAVFPLASLLVLLGAHLAWRNARSFLAAAVLAFGLILLTYGYSTGRLLGPLAAAVAAALLAREKGQWNWSVMGGLAGWLAGLVPLVGFVLEEPGALTLRFKGISDVPGGHPLGIATVAWRALVEINPFFWIDAGDPSMLHHLPGHAAISLGMAALAMFGIARIVTASRFDRWPLFLLVFTLMGVLPGVVTVGEHHQLRLATFAAGVLVLATFGASELAREKGPRAIAAPLGAAIIQGLLYFGAFAAAPPVADPLESELTAATLHALSDPSKEIRFLDCLDPAMNKARVRWYAVLHGVPDSRIRQVWREASPRGEVLTGPSGVQFRCFRVVDRDSPTD